MDGPSLSAKSWVVLLLPFVLIAWFLPGMLDASFGWDDRQVLFENASIRDFSLTSIWSEAFWSFRGHEGMYRPLTAMSLALDHALFGESPLGYHRVNLALHALASLALAMGLVGRRSGWALPLFLILYFHPASAEEAMWISGRVGSLMFLAAGAALIAARRGAWWASMAFVLVAGLCRDDGILFLFLIPLVIRVPIRDHLSRAIPCLLCWCLIRWVAVGSSAFPVDPQTSRSLLERSGDLLASFGFHCKVLLLLERPRLMQGSWPALGVSAVALPLFVAWLVLCWRKAWLLSLRAGLALLLAFLPFSGILRLSEPVGGRYAYSLLPWLLMTMIMAPAVARLRPLWLVPTALLLVPFWWQEVSVLARAESTYERALQYDPDSRRARLNLALEWERLGEEARALHEFEELMRLHPRYSKPAVNRGRLLYLSGQKARGLAALDTATETFPRSSRAWLTYGRLLYREKRDAEAIRALEKCLSLRPTEVQAHLYLCRARLRTGDRPGAMRAWEDLRAHAPQHRAIESLRRQILR